MKISAETTTLYRPVGPKEVTLIAASGFIWLMALE